MGAVVLEFLFLAGFLVAAIAWVLRYRSKLRINRIEQFAFPVSISNRVKEVYPHLVEHDLEQVIAGLREFFAISVAARGHMVAMPSKVVDVAWHEFIVFTRAYQTFCQANIGRFLHHTPAEAMRSPTVAQDGIKRAWRLSCAREKINPQSPNRLPLLFSIDQQLEIPDGYKYSLNCLQKGAAGDTHCASHIGCGGGCGGSSSGGDGDGGGCGGD